MAHGRNASNRFYIGPSLRLPRMLGCSGNTPLVLHFTLKYMCAAHVGAAFIIPLSSRNFHYPNHVAG